MSDPNRCAKWLALDSSLPSTACAYAQAPDLRRNRAPPWRRSPAAASGAWRPPYEKLPGVISTTSGYMGGKTKNPTYEQVSTGTTGHAEVVQVQYDPAQVSYATLLEVFWHNVDPTQRDGQFCDHGSQYRTAIFYHDEEQKKLALASKAAAREDEALQRRHRHQK